MSKRNYLNLTQISLELTGKEGTVRLNSPYKNYQKIIDDCNDYVDRRLHEEKRRIYEEMKNSKNK
jgi:hypothetical protein